MTNMKAVFRSTGSIWCYNWNGETLQANIQRFLSDDMFSLLMPLPLSVVQYDHHFIMDFFQKENNIFENKDASMLVALSWFFHKWPVKVWFWFIISLFFFIIRL